MSKTYTKTLLWKVFVFGIKSLGPNDFWLTANGIAIVPRQSLKKKLFIDSKEPKQKRQFYKMLRNRHRLHKSITMQFNGNAPLKKSTVKSNKYQVFSNKFGDVYHIYPRFIICLQNCNITVSHQYFSFVVSFSVFLVHCRCHQ